MIVKSRRLAIALTVFFLLVAVWFFLSVRRETNPLPPVPSATGPESLRPPGEPGKPHLEVSPDGRLVRIQHKDATGLSPLEIIPSPEGEIRIQRTFSTDGRLIMEEATRNGVPISVPSK